MTKLIIIVSFIQITTAEYFEHPKVYSKKHAKAIAEQIKKANVVARQSAPHHCSNPTTPLCRGVSLLIEGCGH